MTYGVDYLKVLYTNTDGLISKKLELNDLISERKPDVICLTDTKLLKDIEVDLLGWSKYNVWRRDRKHKSGGGVCIMTDRRLVVKEIEVEASKVEIVVIEVLVGGREKIVVATVYVPPQTRAWKKEEHYLLKGETLAVLQDLLKCINHILLCGDINYKDVKWEEYEAGSEEGSWGNNLLDLMVDNTLHQYVKETTRERGGDAHTRLDLVFTREERELEDVTCLPPLGKSNYLVLELSILM